MFSDIHHILHSEVSVSSSLLCDRMIENFYIGEFHVVCVALQP